MITEPGSPAQSDDSVRGFTDEVVVALPQADLVAAELLNRAVWPGPQAVRVHRDEVLGLALLTGLTGLPAAAAAIRAEHADQLAAAEAAAGHGFASLEVLLSDLRRQFRANLAGYVPPMGKNRVAAAVTAWSLADAPATPGSAGPAPAPWLATGVPAAGPLRYAWPLTVGPAPHGATPSRYAWPLAASPAAYRLPLAAAPPSHGVLPFQYAWPLATIPVAYRWALATPAAVPARYAWPLLPRPIGAPASLVAADDAAAGLGVTVGVLDTPIWPHPDLAGRFVAAPGAVLDRAGGAQPIMSGHATFVADLIRQQAPAATLDVRALLDPVTGLTTTWDAAAAIARFGDSGGQLLYLSLGCFTEDNTPPLTLRHALDRLDPAIVVLAPAGNHGQQDEYGNPVTAQPSWPAALDRVVAVGGSDATGMLPISAYGPWVNCLAPAADTVAAYLNGAVDQVGKPFDGYGRWTGTAFAAATVAGVVAARVTGRTSAREAMADLLAAPPGQPPVGPPAQPPAGSPA